MQRSAGLFAPFTGSGFGFALAICALALTAGPGAAVAAAAEPLGSCPNESSRVGASAGLPDCRAYELVTPGLNGAAPPDWPAISVEGVRADGSAIAFIAASAPGDAEGSTATNSTILAARGAGGWSTKSLSAPTPLASGTYFGDASSTVGLSTDLTQSVLWSNQPLAGGASPAGTNLYLRRADGSIVALTKVGALGLDPGGELTGASRDFTRLFLVSTVKQQPSSASKTRSSTATSTNTRPGSCASSRSCRNPGEEAAPAGGALPQGVLPAVSEDGRQVLFKANGYPGLYLRSDGPTASRSPNPSARPPTSTRPRTRSPRASPPTARRSSSPPPPS